MKLKTALRFLHAYNDKQTSTNLRPSFTSIWHILECGPTCFRGVEGETASLGDASGGSARGGR